MSVKPRVSGDYQIHVTPVDNNKFSRIIQPKLISKNFLKGIFISSILIGSVLTLGENSLVGAQTLKEQTTVKQAAVPKIVNISTVVNNKKQSYSQPSVVYNGKLMVPVKSIALTYKATYKYVTNTKQTTVTKGNANVVLTTGSAIAKVNGKSFKLPQKVVTINGAVMAPAEFLKKLNSHTTTSYNSKMKILKISTVKPAVSARERTVNELHSKYNYYKITKTSAMYNVWNQKDTSSYDVGVDFNESDFMSITIKAWKESGIPGSKTIPASVKLALKGIVPSGYEKVYKDVEKYAMYGQPRSLNTSYRYNGYNVNVKGASTYLIVTFKK